MSAIQIFRLIDGKYCLDLKAFEEIISKAKDNLIAIYSMNGPLRMGKSFMLGFFLRYLQTEGKGDWISHELDNTFTYRGGSVRQTTGIWIWDKPFDVQRKDGTKVSVFLMDTQGCFDDQTSMQDNAIVFALSTLLSSLMIFNVQKQLSEDKLQFLQYFTGITSLANVGDTEDKPLQRLLFLIRDWEFDDYLFGYYDKNTSIGGKNYKTDKLNPNSEQPMDVRFVRQSLTKTFEDISVYLMPYPGRDVAVNTDFDIRKVEKDFLIHLKQFVSLLLDSDSIEPKRIGGQYITGAQMIEFMQKWSQVFKCEAIPQSMTIFESMAQLHNEMAKLAAIDNYSTKMKAIMSGTGGESDSDFESKHKQLVEECIDLFKSFKRLGGKRFEDKYLKLINDKFNEFYKYYSVLNKTERQMKELEQKMSEECNQLFETINENEKQIDGLKADNEKERKYFRNIISDNIKRLNEVKTLMTNELKAKNHENKKLRREVERLKLQTTSAQDKGWISELIHVIVTMVLPKMVSSARDFIFTNK